MLMELAPEAAAARDAQSHQTPQARVLPQPGGCLHRRRPPEPCEPQPPSCALHPHAGYWATGNVCSLSLRMFQEQRFPLFSPQDTARNTSTLQPTVSAETYNTKQGKFTKQTYFAYMDHSDIFIHSIVVVHKKKKKSMCNVVSDLRAQ